MPLHNYECDCGTSFEAVVEWDEYTVKCFVCGASCNRVYTEFNGIKHDAPDWVQGVLEVVDKDGGPHCQEFLKHPTRSNRKNWMNKEGLRSYDMGEGIKREKRDTSGLRKGVHESFRRNNTINVRGGK